MNLMKKTTTRDLCLCAMFAALTAVGAFIKIPVPVCPFTLQLTFTTLAGLLLGKKYGTLAVAVYVILGFIGVPIFTQGGGPGYIMQPTFGYLLGFIVGTFLTGLIAEGSPAPSMKRLLVASFTGLVTVYLAGMVYLYLLCNYVLGSPIGVAKVFMTCFVLIAPGDIVLNIAACFLAKRLIPILRRSRES